MSYPNSQGNSAAVTYVWDAGGPPSPDAKGRFANGQGAAAAAIPVYTVAGIPLNSHPFPNDQGKIETVPPQGALPIKVVAKPTANPDGTFPSNPANVNSAIPVYFVASPASVAAAYPNAQNKPAGAIPVWIVA